MISSKEKALAILAYLGPLFLLAVLLAENRLVPEETVFFGDAPADCEAARINQIPFIGICPDGKTSPFPPHTTVVSAIDLDI